MKNARMQPATRGQRQGQCFSSPCWKRRPAGKGPTSLDARGGTRTRPTRSSARGVRRHARINACLSASAATRSSESSVAARWVWCTRPRTRFCSGTSRSRPSPWRSRCPIATAGRSRPGSCRRPARRQPSPTPASSWSTTSASIPRPARCYMALEFLRGKTLEAILAAGQALDWREALRHRGPGGRGSPACP